MRGRCSIAIVVPTLGIAHDLERLIRSLDDQTLRPTEVCVVDQSDGETTRAAIDRAAPAIPVKHLLDRGRGASRARNVGIAATAADVLAFPDDDMWYPPETLERVTAVLAAHPSLAVLAGRFLDPDGRPARLRFAPRSLTLDRRSVWRNAIEGATFFRREAFTVGGFDTAIGPGAATPWGAGEGTDVLLRALEAGFHIGYDPSVGVHGELGEQRARAEFQRVRAYGRGTGMLYRRHGFSTFACTSCVARPVGAALVDLVRAKPRRAARHLNAAFGRLQGLVASRPHRVSRDAVPASPVEADA